MEFNPEMTVHEYLFGPCSEGLLQELAEENSYWESSLEFVGDNADTPLKNLSPRQRSWAMKIKDGLLEKAGEA